MAQDNSIIAVNERLAREINLDARRNPLSKYAGKFVGIANGQVVAVADTLDDVAQQLRRLEPDAAKTFCIEAGVDYDAVEEVWEI